MVSLTMRVIVKYNRKGFVSKLCITAPYIALQHCNIGFCTTQRVNFQFVQVYVSPACKSWQFIRRSPHNFSITVYSRVKSLAIENL